MAATLSPHSEQMRCRSSRSTVPLAWDFTSTRQLAVGSGVRLEGEVCQSRQLAERTLQQYHQRPCSRYRMVGLQGVQVLELRQGRHLLVDFRIVLHGTRAEGVEASIDTKVVIREVRVVTHHRQFVGLGQLGILLPADALRYLVIAEVILRQAIAFAPRLREFEYQISIESVIHKAASFTRLSISSFVRFSVTAKRKPSAKRTPGRMPSLTRRS